MPLMLFLVDDGKVQETNLCDTRGCLVDCPRDTQVNDVQRQVSNQTARFGHFIPPPRQTTPTSP